MVVSQGFLLLIKPLRERCLFLMIQFNSLDRPEDRPNSLNWLVAGNVCHLNQPVEQLVPALLRVCLLLGVPRVLLADTAPVSVEPQLPL